MDSLPEHDIHYRGTKVDTLVAIEKKQSKKLKDGQSTLKMKPSEEV